MAGLCSCSSIHPAPGQLVVTKAKCCRSSEVVEGNADGATSSLRSSSGLALCPPHLPIVNRCNVFKLSLTGSPSQMPPIPRYRSKRGSLSCPDLEGGRAVDSSPSRCLCLGPAASQRSRGRVEGSTCTCFEGVGNGNITTRLVCCARQSNEDKVILIQ